MGALISNAMLVVRGLLSGARCKRVGEQKIKIKSKLMMNKLSYKLCHVNIMLEITTWPYYCLGLLHLLMLEYFIK